jgi:hypothetical protein
MNEKRRIIKVVYNNQDNIISIHYKDGRIFNVPYHKLKISSPLSSAGIDMETRGCAFYYKQQESEKVYVPYDIPLIINNDPEYMFELKLENLSADLKQKILQSKIPKYRLAKMLNTSESQLYRLLDPNRASKNIFQLFKLAQLIGMDLQIRLKKAA